MNTGNFKLKFSAFFFHHHQHSKKQKMKTCSKAACLVFEQVKVETARDSKDLTNKLALTPRNSCE